MRVPPPQKSVVSDMNKYRDAVKVAFQSNSISALEYQEALMRITELEQQRLLESSRDASAGAKRAFQDYQKESTNAAKISYDAISNSLKGMEDSLVEFVQTGKLSFSSLVDSMVADLARLAIQQSITGPIFNALGSAIGGFIGGGYTSTFEGAMSTDWGSWSSGMFSTAHKGGVAGIKMTGSTWVHPSVFEGAPRYHGGGVAGLKPGEIPSILKYGESIFTPEQAASLAPISAIQEMASATTAPQVLVQPQINVNVTPPSGYEANVEQNTDSSGMTNISASWN